jgi:2-iminobutanoate/2-iminopropanoate deaminase
MTKLNVMKRAGKWVSTHPLSPGIRAGDILWMSATAPVDLETSEPVTGDIQTQMETVFNNLEAHLALEGAGLHRVVRCTLYLTRQADLAGANEVYQRRFAEPYPARATLIVAGLVNPAYRVVLDTVAYRGTGARMGSSS